MYLVQSCCRTRATHSCWNRKSALHPIWCALLRRNSFVRFLRMVGFIKKLLITSWQHGLKMIWDNFSENQKNQAEKSMFQKWLKIQNGWKIFTMENDGICCTQIILNQGIRVKNNFLSTTHISKVININISGIWTVGGLERLS